MEAQARVLHATHALLLETQSSLLEEYIAMKAWPQAFSIGKQAISGLVLLGLAGSPVLGILAFKVGKIAALIGERECCVRLLSQVLKYTLCSHHPLPTTTIIGSYPTTAAPLPHPRSMLG